MKLPWPEIDSSLRPDETIRQILDYLVWISREVRALGFHGGPDREPWRARVGQAYRILFLPPVPGHGDPYPPDVPPPEKPGTWPDIPAGMLPGMTVRHQLKVIELLGLDLRDTVWAHGRSPEFQEWDRRLSQARELLDHGVEVEMPEEARTQPSEAALAEARAQDDARRALLRKRERRLKRLEERARKKKTSTAKAPAAKAPTTKKTKAKKKTAPAKKSGAKKTPVRKAAAGKATRAKAKKTPAPKKRPASKATAKKAAARKKSPAKKKAARKKTATRKSRSK